MIVEDIMDLTNVYWPQAHLDADMMAKLTIGMFENGGFENFGVPFCMTVEAEAMGAKVNLGSRINEPRVIEYPINSVTEFKNLKNIDFQNTRAKVVLDSLKILKNSNIKAPIIGNIVGPVSVASSLMEPVNYYKELKKKPKEAHEFMQWVTDNLINFAKEQIKAGAEIIAISDPSGTGEILGPKLFEEFVTSYVNQIIKAIENEVEAGVIVHICGRLKSVYPVLNRLDTNVISFDSITNAKEVAKNVEKKSVMGNISTLALEQNPIDSIRGLARVCIKNGVNILSPACGIGVKTKLENIQAIVDEAKNFKTENKILEYKSNENFEDR